MKNTLLALALSVGLLGAGSANAAVLCFTDVFGFQYEITATKTGMMYWSMNGTVDIGGGTIWNCEGYWDRFNTMFYLNVSNPSPDGCTSFVDNFEISSTSWSPGSISANWESYCDAFGLIATGTMSLTYTNGACPFRTDGSGTPVGPALIEQIAYTPMNLEITETRSLDELLMETELSVTRNGEGFAFQTNLSGGELVIYNHAGQAVATLPVNGNMLYWDGRSQGVAATSGMYLAILRNGEESTTVKFIK